MVMSWKRPENVPFPSVWLTFKAKDLDSDNFVEYRVEDLTEDRFDDAIEHMTTEFLTDEPICKSLALIKDPVSVMEMQFVWRKMFEQKITGVCFKEGSDEIVGMNVLGIFNKSEDKEWVPSGTALLTFYGAASHLSNAYDVYEHYNVESYMAEFGLSVADKYRGRGIGEYIMRARVPLGKAIGCPLTSTVFTAIASQKLAIKAGFEINYEITYDDLAKVDPSYSFPGVETKSIQLMSLKLE